MNSPLATSRAMMGLDDQLRLARQIVSHEANALRSVADSLGQQFLDATRLVADCRGAVLVTGSGKAGRIGQKLADTLASTGTTSHFLDAAGAVHGDLGRVSGGDVVLALSRSGETEEITRLVEPLAELEVPIVAVTSHRGSTLGRAAAVVLELGPHEEACPLGLAPSTSTTMMLAVGDALALVASRIRGFGRDDFARVHPGGSLGRKLAKANAIMRPLDACRVARDNDTLRKVLGGNGSNTAGSRRVGATMLVDAQGRLSGFLTDSDVARLFAAGRDDVLDRPVSEVMTKDPTTIGPETWMSEAVQIMNDRQFSELPVVDAARNPLGLIDRSDLPCEVPQPDEAPTKQCDEATDTAQTANSTLAAQPSFSIYREPVPDADRNSSSDTGESAEPAPGGEA